MGNFCNLISFQGNFSFLNRPNHYKVTVTKVVKVSNFSAQQTVHWLTHGLVIAVQCLGF